MWGVDSLIASASNWWLPVVWAALIYWVETHILPYVLPRATVKLLVAFLSTVLILLSFQELVRHTEFTFFMMRYEAQRERQGPWNNPAFRRIPVPHP